MFNLRLVPLLNYIIRAPINLSEIFVQSLTQTTPFHMAS